MNRSFLALICRLAGDVAFLYLNVGILLGLAFGVLILLRPVTNPIIAPKWRIWIWFIGWYSGFLITVLHALQDLRILPLTLSDLLVPRVYEKGWSGMPAFFPDVREYGTNTILLPGGLAEIPVEITQGLLIAAGLIWLASTAALCIWTDRRDKKLRRIAQQGAIMPPEEREKYGINRDNIVVRRCKGLPTSFVRFGYDQHFGDGTRFVICIQDELPEEQLRLVLLHEMEHIRQHHAWWKSTITVTLYVFFWWNPVLWLAYRLTCRDMELACDEAVMEKLNEADRREYARTLVDLGAGKHMWGTVTSFGECDAALRVRRVVKWKQAVPIDHILGIGLGLLLVLFLFTGGTGWSLRERIQGAEMIRYIHSPNLELHIEETLDREVEFYNSWSNYKGTKDKDDIYFWVELKDGTWCFCTAVYENGIYHLDGLEAFDQKPDLTQGGWHPSIIYGNGT